MAERSYRGLLVSLAFIGVLLDQATKYGVFDWLHTQAVTQFAERREPQGEYEIVPGVFKLLAQFKVADADGTWAAASLTTEPKVNQGALFGFAQKHGYIANWVFAGVSVVAAIAIIIWSRRPGTSRDFSLCAALGLILAGTLGNLYDRVVFDGVRDFLYFYWIEWPVFNFADCFLVCGAGLLLLQAFLSQPATGSVPAAKNSLTAQVAEAS
jgi:lipoprotein signal peptidase